MRTRLSIIFVALTLPGCGGVFDSKIAAPQTYVLRIPARNVVAAGMTQAGSLRVERPEAGPGLDTDRIMLLRSGRRFDFYAASRWAAPGPALLENVVVDALRETGAFTAVFDDTSPYAPRYSLRCGLKRFEADYTSGGGAPTVHVTLDCTLGRHRDRELLADFIAEASVVASEDRLNAVVAAFEAATAKAVDELQKSTLDAIAHESPTKP